MYNVALYSLVILIFHLPCEVTCFSRIYGGLLIWTFCLFFFWGAWVQFSCSVVSDHLWPHGLQHDRLLCPSLIPGACSRSYPLSWWCHLTISFSVVPLSSCLQSFPASGSFSVSHLFTSGGQSIGLSASALVLPMNIQDWFPLELRRIHREKGKIICLELWFRKKMAWCLLFCLLYLKVIIWMKYSKTSFVLGFLYSTQRFC